MSRHTRSTVLAARQSLGLDTAPRTTDRKRGTSARRATVDRRAERSAKWSAQGRPSASIRKGSR